MNNDANAAHQASPNGLQPTNILQLTEPREVKLSLWDEPASDEDSGDEDLIEVTPSASMITELTNIMGES